MKNSKGTARRIFSAISDANVNIRMIDQGSSELNIIIGVDEKGIRHAGIDFVNAPAEDAKYMLVSCSAFVNYLIEKWSKIKDRMEVVE